MKEVLKIETKAILPVSHFYFQFSSVQSLSRVWLCDSMDCSTPGLPVHLQLLELVHSNSSPLSQWCHPTIQPSHPLHFYFRFLIEVIGNQVKDSCHASLFHFFFHFLSFNISTSPSLIFNFLGSGDRSIRKQTSIFLAMAYWNKNL